MGTIFSLEAQVLGTPLNVSAESDGSGITVHTSAGPVAARSVNDAIRIARRDMGEFLLPAQHGDRPWGLRVTVAGAQAVYGQWPLISGGGGGGGGSGTAGPAEAVTGTLPFTGLPLSQALATAGMFLTLGGASIALGNRRRRDAEWTGSYVHGGAGQADTFVF